MRHISSQCNYNTHLSNIISLISDAEMFPRLHRILLSTTRLRSQLSFESPAGHLKPGLCLNSIVSRLYNAPGHKPTNTKLSPRRGLKCSVCAIFFQRQFMRNFCLLQQDTTQTENDIKPTASQLKHAHLEQNSSVLLKEYTTKVLLSDTSYQESNNKSRAAVRDIRPSFQGSSSVNVHSNILSQCAKAEVYNGCHSSTKHLTINISYRLYSTSSNRKDSKGVAEEQTSDVPLKVKHKIVTVFY